MRRNYLTTIILSLGVESILDIRQLLQNNGFVNGLSPLIRRYKFSNAFVLRHPGFLSSLFNKHENAFFKQTGKRIADANNRFEPQISVLTYPLLDNSNCIIFPFHVLLFPSPHPPFSQSAGYSPMVRVIIHGHYILIYDKIKIKIRDLMHLLFYTE